MQETKDLMKTEHTGYDVIFCDRLGRLGEAALNLGAPKDTQFVMNVDPVSGRAVRTAHLPRLDGVALLTHARSCSTSGVVTLVSVVSAAGAVAQLARSTRISPTCRRSSGNDTAAASQYSIGTHDTQATAVPQSAFPRPHCTTILALSPRMRRAHLMPFALGLLLPLSVASIFRLHHAHLQSRDRLPVSRCLNIAPFSVFDTF
ncbi:hypothetical protein EDB85DRAFT_1051896 [Lactarius pseudohatsudake]|nr:hypothetical protein EDB85DRAFT_1051896 [Lactarius pseudohatsudake]